MTQYTSRTSETFRDNASYHSRLISSISELEYAPSALNHQISYANDLQTQLSRSEARLKKLSETTMKERKEHESLRDSTARRLAHKLTGRGEEFQAKASKEEREYVEALEKEFIEKEKYHEFSCLIEEAKREQASLEEKVAQYESQKKELSDLYVRVFDGPTQEYPEDDRLEYQVQCTKTLHDKIQDTLNAECRACELLAQADRIMNGCEAQVKEALTCSQQDMWGRSRMSGVWVRNALSMAQALARQTQDLCQQAQNLSPFVQSIGPLPLAQGSLLGDIFFSNIYSDAAYHRKIASAAVQLEQTHKALRAERDVGQRRANNAGNQLIEVAETLEAERNALVSYRREVLLGISREANTSASDRPPSYDAATLLGASTSTSGASAEPPSIPVRDVEESLRTITTSPGPVPSNSEPSSSRWGSRNPYAAMLANRSRPPSYDEE